MLVKGLYLTKNPKELATRRLTEEIPSINKQPLGDFILTFINRTGDQDLIDVKA